MIQFQNSTPKIFHLTPDLQSNNGLNKTYKIKQEIFFSKENFEILDFASATNLPLRTSYWGQITGDWMGEKLTFLREIQFFKKKNSEILERTTFLYYVLSDLKIKKIVQSWKIFNIAVTSNWNMVVIFFEKRLKKVLRQPALYFTNRGSKNKNHLGKFQRLSILIKGECFKVFQGTSLGCKGYFKNPSNFILKVFDDDEDERSIFLPILESKGRVRRLNPGRDVKKIYKVKILKENLGIAFAVTLKNYFKIYTMESLLDVQSNKKSVKLNVRDLNNGRGSLNNFVNFEENDLVDKKVENYSKLDWIFRSYKDEEGWFRISDNGKIEPKGEKLSRNLFLDWLFQQLKL